MAVKIFTLCLSMTRVILFVWCFGTEDVKAAGEEIKVEKRLLEIIRSKNSFEVCFPCIFASVKVSLIPEFHCQLQQELPTLDPKFDPSVNDSSIHATIFCLFVYFFSMLPTPILFS
jgi:hypothetical protein